jgi:acetolactate synthase I/III small subunit
MTIPLPCWVVAVQLRDDLLALNRAVGIVRRRNLEVASVSLGPSPRVGVSRLTILVTAEAEAAERMANQLRKMSGVLEVSLCPESECVIREQALIRVRVSPSQLGSLLDTVELFQATVLEEKPDQLVLEAAAPPPVLGSLIRALEPFGVMEVVRGGSLAIPA